MGIAAAIGGAAVIGAVANRSSTNKAISAQQQAGDKASAQLGAATDKARDDLFKLYPASQQNMQQGYQGALDVFKQTLPQQANQFQSGNVAAQNQLLAGMPQFQNAILGGPVDYSQFQATQLQQPDFGFTNQTLDFNDPYKQESLPVGPNVNNNYQALQNAFLNNGPHVYTPLGGTPSADLIDRFNMRIR